MDKKDLQEKKFHSTSVLDLETRKELIRHEEYKNFWNNPTCEEVRSARSQKRVRNTKSVKKLSLQQKRQKVEEKRERTFAEKKKRTQACEDTGARLAIKTKSVKKLSLQKKRKGNNNNNLYTHHPTENKYASLQKDGASKKNNKNANLRPDASLALYTPRNKEGAGSSFKTTQREYLKLKRQLASCTPLHKPGAGIGEHGASIDKQMPKTSELLNVEIKRMKIELEEYYNAQKQRIIPRRLTTEEREVKEKKERIVLERQFKYYLKKLHIENDAWKNIMCPTFKTLKKQVKNMRKCFIGREFMRLAKRCRSLRVKKDLMEEKKKKADEEKMKHQVILAEQRDEAIKTKSAKKLSLQQKKEKGNNNNNLYTHLPTENKYASLQKHAASKKNNKNANVRPGASLASYTLRHKHGAGNTNDIIDDEEDGDYVGKEVLDEKGATWRIISITDNGLKLNWKEVIKKKKKLKDSILIIDEKKEVFAGEMTAKTTLVCYFCKKNGHTSSDCPSPFSKCIISAKETVVVPAVACYFCKKIGHESSDCPSLSPDVVLLKSQKVQEKRKRQKIQKKRKDNMNINNNSNNKNINNNNNNNNNANLRAGASLASNAPLHKHGAGSSLKTPKKRGILSSSNDKNGRTIKSDIKKRKRSDDDMSASAKKQNKKKKEDEEEELEYVGMETIENDGTKWRITSISKDGCVHWEEVVIKKKLSNDGMNFKSTIVGNNTKALRKKQQQQVSGKKLLKQKSRSVSSSSRNRSIIGDVGTLDEGKIQSFLSLNTKRRKKKYEEKDFLRSTKKKKKRMQKIVATIDSL